MMVELYLKELADDWERNAFEIWPSFLSEHGGTRIRHRLTGLKSSSVEFSTDHAHVETRVVCDEWNVGKRLNYLLPGVDEPRGSSHILGAYPMNESVVWLPFTFRNLRVNQRVSNRLALSPLKQHRSDGTSATATSCRRLEVNC